MGVDPRAWLAGTLPRINDHPVSQLHVLLPWNRDPRVATSHEASPTTVFGGGST
ncbi:transposase domain-containing protein [Acidisphaera sp. S103]|uniref:transposase domain-containing protein n=1 Tax=Acidisphaera sp. S103 TaxID=1747223 RepID=UPI001C20AE93|nr:transposase domain-containing protein [Acidisphaera sp. S103]